MKPSIKENSKRLVLVGLLLAGLVAIVFLVADHSTATGDRIANISNYWSQTAILGGVAGTSSDVTETKATTTEKLDKSENSELRESKAESSLFNSSPPTVSARSYLIGNVETGQVLAEKNADVIRPIASISKLMTAVIAGETMGYNDLISISENAINTYGFAGQLVADEQLSLETLYYPLILESSNDAATAIAEHYGFGKFMQLMNRKAWAIDMNNTHFADPSGLSAQNTATADDLFRLTRYIYDKRPFILELTTTGQKSVLAESSASSRIFRNNNPMVGQIGFLGGKNGFTDEARHTLLSVFKVGAGENQQIVVIIVLGSESHVDDTLQLRSWVTHVI